MYIPSQDDCNSRKDIPALPFSRMDKTVRKTFRKQIKNPKTIGEHIKNRRLELGLLQKDVARIIEVCEDSITYWETNRNKPTVVHYPKIIQFLGYVPFEVDTSTLGGQMKLYRYLNGQSQESLAHSLDINKSTVLNYENNKHKPSIKTFKKFKSL
jgi:DNA-binding XRE family transcriptional regulator